MRTQGTDVSEGDALVFVCMGMGGGCGQMQAGGKNLGQQKPNAWEFPFQSGRKL